MVHHERRAYVIMLSSEDSDALETLELEQVTTNLRALLMRSHSVFGFGLKKQQHRETD